MKRFILALLVLFQSSILFAADVRFHNDTSLGLNGFRLSPHNGNAIRVWNPLIGAIDTYNVPNTGLQGVVSNCVIDDVVGQSMPYNIIHIAYLKKDASGNPYINWLPWSLAGTTFSSEGWTTDLRTGKGHIVGMAIRRPTFEIQGQYNSELLVSYYNRGEASFFSIPACTVAAGTGWQPCGVSVEILIWQDEWPKITANLNMTGTVAGSSLQAALVANGAIANGVFTAQSNATPGNPYPAAMTFPGAPVNPGFYTYQIYLQTNAGTVTLGAALNSILDVHGKF